MNRDGSCSGKKAFRTYWQAIRNAKGLNRQYHGAKANVYRCPYCPYYHTGNSLGEKEKRRGSRKQITDDYRQMAEDAGLSRDGFAAPGGHTFWDE